MRVRIRDTEALRAIRPLDLTSYLRANGWTIVLSGASEPVTIWALVSDRGEFELLVPKHQRWADYPRRMHDVIATLSEAEDRSELALLHDIPRTTKDVVRVRAVAEARDPDSIALLDGVRLVRASRTLLLAAACSAHQPKRAYHTRKPARATDYVKQLRLGHTERGSYVLRLYSAVPPALVAQQSFDFAEDDLGEEPFARRVTRTLATALSLVRAAADQGAATGELEAFEAGVSHGISADLCEALAATADCTGVEEVEIGIRWAPARPMSPPLQTSHGFTPDTLEVIKEAGRMLREKTPEPDFELSGPVIEVTRPESDLHGTAVVYGSIAGKPRRVRVEVWGDDWETAHNAMKNRGVLHCVGELVREGKSFSLKHGRELREEPLDEE